MGRREFGGCPLHLSAGAIVRGSGPDPRTATRQQRGQRQDISWRFDPFSGEVLSGEGGGASPRPLWLRQPPLPLRSGCLSFRSGPFERGLSMPPVLPGGRDRRLGPD